MAPLPFTSVYDAPKGPSGPEFAPEPTPGLLGTLGTFASRPFWATTALLSGNLGGVARNLAQSSLDIPTGGWLRRGLSLGNLFSETGDITSQYDRAGASELLRRYGMAPSSSMGRLATDLIGGIVLDPLTYVTFTSGALAKTALLGASRGVAGLTLAEKLGRTALGREAFTSARAGVLQHFTDPLTQLPARLTPWMERQADILAAEKVLGTALGPTNARAIEAAQEALEAAGKLDPGGWNFAGVRFANTQRGPLQLLGQLSLPGLVRGAVKRGAPDVARVVDDYAELAWRGLTGAFYDKTLHGVGISEGFRQEARKHAARLAASDRTSFIRRNKIWDKFSDAEQNAVGEVFSGYADRFSQAPTRGAQLQAQMLRQIKQRLPAKTPQEIEGAITAYQKDMRAVQEDLFRRGIWGHKDPNPFYFPAQAMFSGPGALQRTADRSIFEIGRKHETRSAFERSLKSLAEQLGYTRADFDMLPEFHIGDLHLKRELAHNKTVFRDDLTKAAVQAGFRPANALDRYITKQFEHVPLRQGVLAKIIGGGTFQVPIRTALSPAARERLTRRGIQIRRDPAELERIRKSMPGGILPPNVLENIPEVALWKFRGWNYFYKPALTTMPQNPGYHVRNTVSSWIMSRLDPDMRIAGAEMLQSVPYLSLIKSLKLSDPTHVAKFIRAAEGDDAALALLRQIPDLKIGKWSADEVAVQLRAIVGGSNPADLMLAMDELDRVGKLAWRQAPYRKAVALGEQIANNTENTMRVAGYLSLLRRGVEPTEALTRVQKTFVNYARQSSIERGVRDIMPFVRFSIGAAAWLPEMAARPRFLTPLARMQASMQGEPGEVPESMRGALSVPLGEGRFLTSLGLPQEAATQLLGGITEGAEGFRKNILGAVNPAIRLPAEAVTNRSFYFGDEFGEYRRAPAWAPGFLTSTVTLPSGAKRTEWNGKWNAILGALPTSRVSSTINSLLDERKGLVEKILATTTGVRIRRIDAQRAIAEAIEETLRDRVDAGEVGIAEHYYLRLGEGDAPPEILDRVQEELDALRNTKKRKKEGS